MSGFDPKLQYYLTVDASKSGIEGVLFQLHDVLARTEAGPKHWKQERIIIFISFRLADVETRYTTTEQKALAIVRYLAEVQ